MGPAAGELGEQTLARIGGDAWPVVFDHDRVVVATPGAADSEHRVGRQAFAEVDGLVQCLLRIDGRQRPVADAVFEHAQFEDAVEQSAIAAPHLSDRALILDMGDIVFDGTAGEVIDTAELRQEYLAI